VTDRTQSEDTGHEEVEEVLNVATTLHDMGRGENVRNKCGRGHSRRQCAPTRSALGDLHRLNEHDERGLAGDCMPTPRMQQNVGDDVRRGRVANEPTSACAYGQA